MGDGYDAWQFLWAIVPLAGVIGWVIVSTTKMRSRSTSSDQLAAALAQSAESNKQLAERIDQLDRRLAAVEKTLNEVG
jgi:hypothetical protein